MIPRLASPTGIAARIAFIGRGVFSSTLIFGALLPVNVLQGVGVLLLPFSRRAYRYINRHCADFWWGLCVFALERVQGMRLVISGDQLSPREDAIVICNHQQMSDIPVLMCLARRQGRLGDMKWVVKQGLKYVPLIGWGMQMLGCLFVKRAWTEDKATVQRTFASFHRERLPIWLMSFPEGTRITRAKLERSNRFAGRLKIDPTRHVLLPRAKGFVAAVDGLRGHVPAVYDATIGFPGGIPTLWQMLCGGVSEAHLQVRRYPLNTLPTDAVALEQWLIQRFREKDDRMERFRNGIPFETEPGTQRHIPRMS